MTTSEDIRGCLAKLASGDLESLPDRAAAAAASGTAAESAASARRRPEAVEQTARKIARGEDLTREDRFIAEAIIIPDKRPVIDILQGDYRVSHPDWTHFETDAGIRQRLRAAIPSIGRLDLPGDMSLPFAGTAFVVGPDLMMTNRHVAELFCLGLGLRELRFKPGARAEVDFLRERDRYDALTVGVREVVLIHPYWDAAILRVEGLPEGHAPLRLSTRSVEDMAGQDVAVIGYPAYDPRNDASVQNEVFGGIYNVKRLQPGKLGALAQVRSFDETVRAATHDSSTLGGNSGSAVISAATGDVVALHFGGRYLEANFAVPASELARDSRVVDTGIHFSSPAEPVLDAFAQAWASADEAAAPAAPSGVIGLVGQGRTMTFTVPLTISITVGP